MLRRHFITGEYQEQPYFIITYYAPQHIPFHNGYKGELKSIMSYGGETGTDMTFKCVLDKWNNGIGEYGIILNNPNKLWTGTWHSNNIVGGIGWVADLNTLNALYDFSNIITSIILPKEIKHLDDDLICDHIDPFNVSVEYVTLPESLETLGNNVLRALRVLKKIIIPDTVNSIGNTALQITSSYNIVNVPAPGNISLEEIILKPFNPPETYYNPFGEYDPVNGYVNPNLKIRVYADCIDKYKNDAMWGQYSDLYDTINNAIVYYTEDGSRNIYEQNNNIIEFTKDIYKSLINSYNIYLPNSVTNIPDDVLENSRLNYIIIPDNVIIGNRAFIDSSLTSITIGKNVTIKSWCFACCYYLNNIEFKGTIEEWNNIEKGSLWNYDLLATVVHCTDGDVAL